MPLGCGGGQRTFIPLRRCWTVGQCLGHVAITRVSRVLGCLGPLATWLGVALVCTCTVGMAMCRCGISWVVVCAGCEESEDCVARLCATPWVWLCQ